MVTNSYASDPMPYDCLVLEVSPDLVFTKVLWLGSGNTMWVSSSEYRVLSWVWRVQRN